MHPTNSLTSEVARQSAVDLLASMCSSAGQVRPPYYGIQPSAALVQKYMRVEMALSILQEDAGLSAGLMSQLRDTVQSGMTRQTWNGVLSCRDTSPPASIPYYNAPSPFCTSAGSSPTPSCTLSPTMARPHPVRTVKPPSSKKQQLTSQEAAEIYLLRAKLPEPHSQHCPVIAARYSVTPKTIQDVWSGRTWVGATKHLWTAEEIVQRQGSKRRAPLSLASFSEKPLAAKRMRKDFLDSVESMPVANVVS